MDAFECKTTGSGELGGGDGGALWNGETGKVVIKSHLSMEACGQSVSLRENLSGLKYTTP